MQLLFIMLQKDHQTNEMGLYIEILSGPALIWIRKL